MSEHSPPTPETTPPPPEESSDCAPPGSRRQPCPTVDDVAGTHLVLTVDEEVRSFLDPEEDQELRAAFAPGAVLQERYVLERELGRGGMGQVYLALDKRLDRLVAIKVIRQDVAGGGSDGPDDGSKALFAEEAKLGANLTHPGIATVFDFGFHEDQPFTVFEYIPGETLRELLHRRGRLPLEEVRLLIAPLAQALDFAHGRRVVHRDLKPANIRATAQGQFKILDLGLAKDFCRHADWRFAGTPAYASHEQAAGEPCDGRTDQYALALIAFEMLAGRRLFQQRDVRKLLEMHRSTEPSWPPAGLPELPEEVLAALRRAVSKKPADRFPTCEAFALALGCQLLSTPAVQTEMLRFTALNYMTGSWRSTGFRLVGFLGTPYLALGRDALWGLYRGEMIHWPLSAISSVQRHPRDGVLHLEIHTASGPVRQAFHFANPGRAQAWKKHLQALRRDLPAAPSQPIESPRVDPVVLLRALPLVRLQLLGPVEYQHGKHTHGEAGLQLRAAMMGADAVVDIREERLSGFKHSKWHFSGTAVRTVDHEGRQELCSRWFASQVARLSFWMLVVTALSFVARLLGDIITSFFFFANLPGAPLVRGSELPEQLGFRAGATALIHLWPFTVALLLRRLLWPQLLRPAAVTLLALATIPLPAALGGVAAAVVTGNWLAAGAQALELLALGNLALLVFAVFVARRCWRAYHEFRALAPDAADRPQWPRRVGAKLTAVASGAFAVLLAAGLGYAGFTWVSTFTSPDNHRGAVAHYPKKEATALAYFKEGMANMASQPEAAERAFRDALPLWKDLTAAAPAIPAYRQNFAATYYNLGLLLLGRAQYPEAAKAFTAAETAFAQLAAEFPSNGAYQANLARARKNMALVRSQEVALGYEMLAAKRYADAEPLFRQLVERYEKPGAELPGNDRQRLLAISCHGLGQVMAARGHSREALKLFRRALDIVSKLADKSPQSPDHAFLVADMQYLTFRTLS
jgi:tetratricopeptide (TPR) repeat protein